MELARLQEGLEINLERIRNKGLKKDLTYSHFCNQYLQGRHYFNGFGLMQNIGKNFFMLDHNVSTLADLVELEGLGQFVGKLWEGSAQALKATKDWQGYRKRQRDLSGRESNRLRERKTKQFQDIIAFGRYARAGVALYYHCDEFLELLAREDISVEKLNPREVNNLYTQFLRKIETAVGMNSRYTRLVPDSPHGV